VDKKVRITDEELCVDNKVRITDLGNSLCYSLVHCFAWCKFRHV